MNYVRLVSPGVGGGGSGGGGGGATLIRPTPPTNKPIAPAASQPIKIKAMPIAPSQQVRWKIFFSCLLKFISCTGYGGKTPFNCYSLINEMQCIDNQCIVIEVY